MTEENRPSIPRLHGRCGCLTGAVIEENRRRDIARPPHDVTEENHPSIPRLLQAILLATSRRMLLQRRAADDQISHRRSDKGEPPVGHGMASARCDRGEPPAGHGTAAATSASVSLYDGHSLSQNPCTAALPDFAYSSSYRSDGHLLAAHSHSGLVVACPLLARK